MQHKSVLCYSCYFVKDQISMEANDSCYKFLHSYFGPQMNPRTSMNDVLTVRGSLAQGD